MASSRCGACESAPDCDRATAPTIDVDAQGRVVQWNGAAEHLVCEPGGADLWTVIAAAGCAWQLVPRNDGPVVARLTARAEADAAMLAAATAGIVARGITHDLNNLFTCILASATIPPRGDVGRHLGAIAHAVRQGAELLALLRDLAPHPGPRVASVRVAIEWCGVLLERVAAKVGVVIAVDACDGRVALAEHELQQILVNLSLNAIDAMSNGGGRLAIEARRDGARIAIHVRDSGPGIELAVRTRLFEPGRSTKRGHSGIGLAVVRDLVERGRGSIRVESHPGVGAEFVVALPVVEEPP